MGKAVMSVSVRLVSETCCNCGVVFAMPDYLIEERKQTGKNFYCPAGHSMVYHSEIERLKGELDKERKRREWSEAQARTAREEAEKERAALARLKRRANAGVCPHCHRTVKQMARHIETKHPHEKAA